MIGERKRAGPVMCVGDWNVDYSPTFEHSPYQTGQHDATADRRDIIDSFCAANALDLCFVDVIEDLPKNPLWAEKCMVFPFTRVPNGFQCGRPVLIDFCFASRGLITSSDGTWKNVPSDHAITRYSVSFRAPVKVYKRCTWVVEKRDEAVSFLCRNWPCVFTNSHHFSTVDATPLRFFEHLRTVRDRFSQTASCSRRRVARFPFSLRVLCFKYENASGENKDLLSKQLWSAKTKWFEHLRVLKLKAGIDCGRSVKRTKKLHHIRSIRGADGRRKSDDENIVEDLIDNFSAKSGTRNLSRREALTDLVRSAEGVAPPFDDEDVAAAFTRVRKSCRLDSYGVCMELLRVAFEAMPVEFTEWLQYVCSSEAMMRSLESPLLCYGKSSADTATCDIRGIIPPCALLKLLDDVLARSLSNRLSFLLPKLPGCLIGARKFTQTKDLSMGAQLLVEKGLDTHSSAAFAQADVARYFDSLPLLLIVFWLLAHKVERCLLAAIVRHQLFTALRISRGAASKCIVERTSGGLTGSNLALTMARIPIEATFLELWGSCYDLGFRAGAGRVVFGSWVDNIYTAASCPSDACALLEAVFDRLRAKWCLEMKPGSAEVLVCDGFDLSDTQIPDTISVVRKTKVLGCTIMSNGSISESWRLCTASAWSAFHANVRCRFWRRLGLTRRLALLDRVVKPILLFRLQPFVPTVHWAGQLRKLQRHMVSRALGNYRLPCESLRDYWKRVSRIVRQHLGVSVSDWAQAWISSAVSWDDHAQRDFEEQERYFSSSDFEAFRRRCSMFCRIQDKGSGTVSSFEAPDLVQLGVCEGEYATAFSWACRLTRHLNAKYFDEVRVVRSRGVAPFLRPHSRTSTRSRRGHVDLRYHDAVTWCREQV